MHTCLKKDETMAIASSIGLPIITTGRECNTAVRCMETTPGAKPAATAANARTRIDRSAIAKVIVRDDCS